MSHHSSPDVAPAPTKRCRHERCEIDLGYKKPVWRCVGCGALVYMGELRTAATMRGASK